MKLLSLSLLCCLLTCLTGGAADKKFNYKKVVAPPIAAMPTPKMWKGMGELNLSISSSDEKVRDHVKQGFALLHAQWDVEAYRHFAAALKLDDHCLMAYSGVVMSLLNPEHEWKKYRSVAINRMQTLIEHKNADGEFSYPDIERGYAIAVITLNTINFRKGVEEFSQLADKYPNDLQLQLLKPFLNRGKYNSFGNADLKQERAVKSIKAVLDKNLNNPLALNFYVMMKIEAPYNAVNQKTEVLPYVDKLLLISDEIPSWQTLLGYAAWRTGDLEQAKVSFENAVRLYEGWRKESKAKNSECDGLYRTYAFLAVVYYQLGDKKSLQAVMSKLKGAKYSRRSSPVYGLYEWSYQLIDAKMLFAENTVGSIKKGLAALPKIDSKDTGKSAQNKVIKGYQAYGLSLLSLKQGDKKKAEKMIRELARVIHELKVLSTKVQKKSYYPHYLISQRTLRIYHNEVVAMLEEKSGAGSLNWYNEAIDLQLGPSRLFAANSLYPMEYKLARYYESQEKMELARDTYTKAYQRMPSHPETKKAYETIDYKIGVFYEKKGDLKKARESYAAAFKKYPRDEKVKAAYDRLMKMIE